MLQAVPRAQGAAAEIQRATGAEGSQTHLSPLPPRMTLRPSEVVKVADGTTPACRSIRSGLTHQVWVMGSCKCMTQVGSMRPT